MSDLKAARRGSGNRDGRDPLMVLAEHRPPVPDVTGQLRRLLSLATATTGLPFGVVNATTADGQHHVAAVGIDPGVCSGELSLCGQARRRGETTVVPDTTRDPGFRNHPFVTGQLASIRSFVSVPLATAGGVVLGTLCLFSSAPAELPPQRKATLDIIASQVADVLELQDHARLLALSLAEARTSNALLESFAGRISHDLRNPLSSIVGFAELGELHSTADAAEFRVIGRTSRRMLAMLDDILSFSRIDGALRPRRMSLAALVRDVEEDLAAALNEAGAELRVSDFILNADAGQLRTLLQNLIHNAVSYRRPGIPPVVTVRAHAVADGVELQVADNGKGIPEDERTHVTEPLVRLHRDGDPPGSGLGLATCVRIATAHGGRLAISSGPDGGTIVSVRLPASAPGPGRGPAGPSRLFRQR